LQAGAGRLTFAEGQRHTSISVTILRWTNSTEGDRTFDVQLLNPTGGASTGIGSTISVTLLAGMHAFGVFYFADDSLSVVTAEDLDSPVVEVTVEVINTVTLLTFLDQELILCRYSSCSSSFYCWGNLFKKGLVVLNAVGMKFGKSVYQINTHRLTGMKELDFRFDVRVSRLRS